MSIKATFPTGVTELTIHGLHQWDYGQTLEIQADDLPANVEVHFACVGMTEAIVRKCTIVKGSAQASIPNICLEQGTPLKAWVCECGESSGETIKTITMPVTQRAKPRTYTPPEETNEAEGGTFLQAFGGSWRPSENLKVIGKTLYLGNTALSEKRLKALSALVNLEEVKGLYTIDVYSLRECRISDVSFMSNGNRYSSIRVEYSENDYGHSYDMYYDNTQVVTGSAAAGWWYWVDEAFARIDFGETPQDLTVSEYESFTSFASRPSIEFTFDGQTLETPAGTTWGEFHLNDGVSEFTTLNGYACYHFYGAGDDYYYIYDINGNKVPASEEIKEGASYVHGN